MCVIRMEFLNNRLEFFYHVRFVRRTIGCVSPVSDSEVIQAISLIIESGY